ncbi:Bug family tripartite tricarboxylate transporter substrate binding protein [Variovorax arabinosiphilus]|uniref:Bug family tripartite tricarboxylate transporter substrate binding protein n=1 Tax=Variovorax arabinosiphilus TaxID=3053498 RepID=UPI00257832A5|nr:MULTISPECIES: tripartite tricarboxylate transporter substrate binding protein [unclassified Variovorax]MDM0122598.1 tripartite tricarboxylate transporter substrate binding protein [Variovorax sp. J2L1-78]MDM0130873.1 tripartite tricarboxylate transporter substrate binding protein [Variovorax sp. J2L1-63]MDM0235361.1 tripartite tricarboxylate transporter substrate binding protein [Variovorax sp. J2R1-6]
MNQVRISRRGLLQAALLTAAIPSSVFAQESRPIEWVVGYAAGGGSDVLARTVGDAMGKSLGQAIVINNKPGAATNIAAGYVANSKEFGHLLLTADFATLAVNPWLFSKLPYDPAKDFRPVGMLARFPMLLVISPKVPAKNLAEFLAWAKENGPVTYGSAGVGSPHHLTAELFRERTGLNLQHAPYRGAAPAVQDLMGGQIPFAFIDTASVQQYITTGKLRALGVASPGRLATMPEIPTLSEQGVKDFTAYAWQGLVVPAGTSPDVVSKLSKALQEALNSTQVKARFQTLALEGMPGTPQQMTAYVDAERERWGKVIKANSIRID